MTSSAVRGGRPNHREALLREGLHQLFTHGYHGTTVDGLLQATGVPKGSFYHHFGTKEAFTAAVVERYGGFHLDRLAAWAAKPELSTPDMLVGYFEELCGIFVGSGFLKADLAGKLATEVAATLGPVHGQVGEFVRAWRAQLEVMLAEGQGRGDVRSDRVVTDLSAAIHALLDGSFIVVASTRDEASLQSVARAIRSLTAA